MTDRAEKVRAGVLSTAEDAAADYQLVPLADHVEGYENYLRARGVTNGYRKTTLAYLRQLLPECSMTKLSDLKRSALERWLVRQADAGASARSRNAGRMAAVTFCNWCVETNRLTANPFDAVPQADEKSDPRRRRRALAEYGRETVNLPPDECKGRRTWRKAPLTLAMIDAAAERGRKALAERPDKIAELERTGRERALVYKTLVLTGLRRGELGSLTVGQLVLDGPAAYAVLEAADEKNRQGSDIPLRGDWADDIREWLTDELSRIQSEARLRLGRPVPLRLPADRPVFNVPNGLVRILDRDMKAAGIPKRDERGRTVDVHALRTSFGTLLTKGGVAPRTVMSAMRHSSLDLTMGVYTDPALLDVAGAMRALPSLPLDADDREVERMAATGTEDVTGDALAPLLAPNLGKGSISGASADKNTDPALPNTHADAANVSGDVDKRKDSPSTVDNESCDSGREDLNLRPLDPQDSARIATTPSRIRL